MISLFCNSRDGSDAGTGSSVADPVASIPVALTKLRALLTIAVDDLELLFWADNDDDIPYNYETGHFWTEADAHAAGKRVRFGRYGSLTNFPYFTARTRVTGWAATEGTLGRVEAPLAGSHCDVWLDDGTQLERSKRGRFNTFYRISLWEPDTLSVIISTSLVPAVASVTGMVMAVQMGWNISYLRVAHIEAADLPGYNGISRVTFEAEGIVEFAKSDGGMGSLFKYGPFHNNSGQRFWWENMPEFLAAGQWWHDTNLNKLHIALPSSVPDAEALDEIGVYVSNGVSTLLSIGGSVEGSYVENFDFEDIGVKHVGNNLPATEGFIGYGAGLSFFNNGGAIGFRSIPAAISMLRVRSVRIRRNYFREIGAIAFRAFHGTTGIEFDGNAFARIGSSAVAFNGVYGQYDFMTPAQQPTDLLFRNNVAFDTGWLYAGSCFFIGPWNRARVLNNSVTNCTDDGFSFNTGARCQPGWQRDMLVMDCDANTVMTMTTDGGAFYSSGNLNSRRLAQHPPLHPPGPHLRMIRNRVRNTRTSGYDPGGGHSASFYLDLGSMGVVIAQNYVENSDLFLLENCSLWNTIGDNCLVNVDRVDRTFYSGFNDVRDVDGGGQTATLYYPPFSNPPGGTLDGNPIWKGTWSNVGNYSTGDIVIRTPSGSPTPLSYRALRATTNEAPEAVPADPFDPPWVRDDVLSAQLDTFDGRFAWTGRGFKSIVPFPTILHCFRGTSQDYESLSSRFNNGPDVKVNMANVGPDAATRARFPGMFTLQ